MSTKNAKMIPKTQKVTKYIKSPSPFGTGKGDFFVVLSGFLPYFRINNTHIITHTISVITPVLIAKRIF